MSSAGLLRGGMPRNPANAGARGAALAGRAFSLPSGHADTASRSSQARHVTAGGAGALMPRVLRQYTRGQSCLAPSSGTPPAAAPRAGRPRQRSP